MFSLDARCYVALHQCDLRQTPDPSQLASCKRATICVLHFVQKRAFRTACWAPYPGCLLYRHGGAFAGTLLGELHTAWPTTRVQDSINAGPFQCRFRAVQELSLRYGLADPGACRAYERIC